MTPALRNVLDKLDEIIVADDATSRELWDVLTALRGPDSGDARLKHESTVHIRQAAFPRTAEAQRNDGPFIEAYMTPTATFNGARLARDYNGGGYHFSSHAMKAAVALDLMPQEVLKKAQAVAYARAFV